MNSYMWELNPNLLCFHDLIIDCTYSLFIRRTMWPSPSPAWQTSPCSHPGTSSMRSHSSPQTSWSTPSTLLFPGVPQGHPPPQQLHRDHVPPGYQFSTPPLLETAPPHPDSTLYVPVTGPTSSPNTSSRFWTSTTNRTGTATGSPQ